jgi:hypothetical protein
MKKLISILSLIILTSCTFKEKENVINKPEKKIRIDKSDEKTAIDFYKWYTTDKQIKEAEFLKDLKDSNDFYAIDFTATEEYLTILKKTGLVSEKYLETQREYFKECEKHFKENPANDGPPYGLDYDLIMLSQDYEIDLANTDKIKVEEIYKKNNQSKLKLLFFGGGKIDVTLSKTDGKWLIDKIENGFEE